MTDFERDIQSWHAGEPRPPAKNKELRRGWDFADADRFLDQFLATPQEHTPCTSRT